MIKKKRIAELVITLCFANVQGLGLTTTCSDGDLVDLKEVRSRARVLIPQSDWLLSESFSGVADWKTQEHSLFDQETVTVEKKSLTPTLEIHQILNHCSKPPYDQEAEATAIVNGETIEYTEYDLVNSESLVSSTDISEFTTQELTDEIIANCASCTYTPS